MRTATLIVALAVACTASPAPAQRILTVQDQPAPAAPQTPEPAAPQTPTPEASPAQPQAQTPPNGQVEKQPESQGESQAKRQDRAPPGVPDRYSFTRVDNGLLRLDHKSGDVAYCTPHNAGWSCEGVPQKGASLEQQIAALREQVDALRKEVAALRAPPPPPPHPVPPQTVPPTPHQSEQTGSITIPLPSHEDIARARGFIADTWHRLVDLIENLQKDMMRKSGGSSGGVADLTPHAG